MKSLRARLETLEAPEKAAEVDMAKAISDARKRGPQPLQSLAELKDTAESHPDQGMREIARARIRAGLAERN